MSFTGNVGGLIDKDEFLRIIAKQHFPIIKKHNNLSYYNIPAAFDIEVSSFTINDEKCACMYVWQFGIYNWVTYGRTWDEFSELISKVSDILDLSETLRLIVYIQNFSYEFQFIRKRIQWTKLFFLESRKPIYGIAGGIEYRDSLKLSNKSLANMAKDLRKYKCKKLVGDLDYYLIRTSKTPLTAKELGYCENDIRVLLCYIQEKIEQDGGIHKIPLTNTGYVREYCRTACFKRWQQYRNFMNALSLAPDEYSSLKRGFQGGFTHANAHYAKQIVSNVGSFDFTSSYPAVMLSEKFPMSQGRYVEEITSDDEFERLLDKYCCLITATFSGLNSKLDYDHPISKSKINYHYQRTDLTEDNGRIVEASEITLTFTEQDFFRLP